MLEFLSPVLEGSRVLVLATYRDAELTRRHPLTYTLAELTKERRFHRVLLRGLSCEDVERYIEVAAGVESPPRLADAVHAQTDGNALFVTEVVRLLVQEGDLAARAEPVDGRSPQEETWSVRIPEGVRAVVGRRLDRLSERCNEMLTAAAVIGREFELEQLQRLSSPTDDLLDLVEEALTARVIEELPGEAGRYQFTHSLVQHTLADELPGTQRIRLHAKVGEALEEMWLHGLPAHAAELARHFTEAAPIVGTEKLVHYSVLAGEHALGEYAFEEALSLFQRALGAIEGQPTDDRQAQVLFCLGKAQAGLLRMADAEASLTKAFDYYVGVEKVARAVEVAEYPVRSGNSGVSSLLVRALELVPPDSHEAGRLLSQHGLDVAMQGDYEGAQEALARALAIAEREGDVALEMWTLARTGHVELYYMRMEDCVEKDARALELNSRIEDPNVDAFARMCFVGSLACIGDSGAARAHLDTMLAMAEKARYRGGLMDAFWIGAIVYLALGDWESTREVIDRGLSMNPVHMGMLDAGLFLEYTLGDFERGQSFMERELRLIQARPPGSSSSHVAIAWADSITGSTERLEWSKATLQGIASRAATPWQVMYADIGLSLVAIRQHDRAEAERLYEALQPFRGTVQAHESTSIDRLLGLLALTSGDMDRSQADFERALAFCRKAGYRPELASSCSDYADMLLQRDTKGDQHRATALLDESLAISSELGMRPLMERVLSRKMSLQGINVSSPQTSIDAVISAVEIERPNLQPHAAPDGTVTVMFTDIEGSTAMTERLGDRRAQEVLHIHNAIIREQVAAHQGFEVKSQGDGFMVAFSSARRGLESAIAIQQTFAAHNSENPTEPIQVRIGLHTGETIREGEDFFGKTVILAARIASGASGDHILVSSLLKSLVESSGEFEFDVGREMELKGLTGTHQVFEVNLP